MLKKLGKYEILGVLGRGSMGVVYKGVDPAIGKLVAIKTMNPKILKQAEMQERFHREGAILGQLQHKNIISVYNTGQDNDIFFIAMEYLNGTSLDRALEDKQPLPLSRTLNIIRQVCDGVNAAHRKAVTHRDIKPANIFVLENDLAKVLDFGVAHFQDSQLTNSGMLLGTINYIAPEQITGLKVDYRADIFSIGVILYEMLTGNNPFLGKTVSKTMVKIVNEEPEPPQGISPMLLEVLQTALSKDRDRRYASSQLMARDIESVLRHQTEEFSIRDPQVENELGGQLTPDEREKRLRGFIDDIKKEMRHERFEKAEKLLVEMRTLNQDHPSLIDLELKLNQAKIKAEDRRQFAEKFTGANWGRAQEQAQARHYVLAVEHCNKVLDADPSHQEAKALRLDCLNKISSFLKAEQT